MRVIGGAARGMKLFSPKGTEVRPMLDRVKEALFNILADHVPGAEALDLFAGTGSLGIEALSRGAKGVVFVESDPECVECIRRNLEKTRLEAEAKVLRRDAMGIVPVLKSLEKRCDLVFLDPPYRMTESVAAMRPLESLLAAMEKEGVLRPDAVVMIHHGRRTFAVSTGLPFEIYDERWYGHSGLAFLRPRNKG